MEPIKGSILKPFYVSAWISVEDSVSYLVADLVSNSICQRVDAVPIWFTVRQSVERDLK